MYIEVPEVQANSGRCLFLKLYLHPANLRQNNIELYKITVKYQSKRKGARHAPDVIVKIVPLLAPSQALPTLSRARCLAVSRVGGFCLLARYKTTFSSVLRTWLHCGRSVAKGWPGMLGSGPPKCWLCSANENLETQIL